MKMRNGFVSNSSSSSFIVIRKGYDKKQTPLITPKQEKALVDYGFKRVECSYADQVPGEFYTIRKPPTKKYLKMLKRMGIKSIKKTKPFATYFNYGYDITCNQDDVIYFLLKNNISFEANVHYGHETVIYKKNTKYFLKIENFGVQAVMSNWEKSYDEMLERSKDKEAITKINVREWVNQQEKWHKEPEERDESLYNKEDAQKHNKDVTNDVSKK